MTHDAKRYQFLKTVQGSRDGLTVHTFNRGDVHELDEALAEQFFEQGAVKETDLAVGGHPTGAADDGRVLGGEAGVPLNTQRVEELVSVARDHYGLDADSTMSEADLRDRIERARGGKTPAADRETKVTGPAETKPARAAETKKPAKPSGRKPRR